MPTLWIATGLASLLGGASLLLVHGIQWMTGGNWQPASLADYVRAPATRSLLGLNSLLEAAFALPIALDLMLVGVLTVVLSLKIKRWRRLARYARA